PDYPRRLTEENLWRAIRYGLSGELIDLSTGEVRPARAHLERLLEWVLPAAEEVGAAPYLAIPTANAAERQIARHREGATLEEIYAELARPKEPVAYLPLALPPPPDGAAPEGVPMDTWQRVMGALLLPAMKSLYRLQAE